MNHDKTRLEHAAALAAGAALPLWLAASFVIRRTFDLKVNMVGDSLLVPFFLATWACLLLPGRYVWTWSIIGLAIGSVVAALAVHEFAHLLFTVQPIYPGLAPTL